jgi:hypothetical protein
MSNKIYNWAKKIKLPRGEKTLLLVLANSINDKNGYCYPTNKTLADWCSCSERTIRRYVKSLISKNIIQTEDVRNQLGRRVTTKYIVNFEQDLNSLPDNDACGQVQSLPDRLSSLPDKHDTPTGQVVRQDYIIIKNNNQKNKQELSLVDNFDWQKTDTILGLKFRECVKINDDTMNTKTAEKLYKQKCWEYERPLERADQLNKIRQYQIDKHKELSKKYKMPGIPGIKNWVEGERWHDVIKPLGEKKKVSPYIKCSRCGEEYLKGSYCKICARKYEEKVAYA